MAFVNSETITIGRPVFGEAGILCCPGRQFVKQIRGGEDWKINVKIWGDYKKCVYLHSRLLEKIFWLSCKLKKNKLLKWEGCNICCSGALNFQIRLW